MAVVVEGWAADLSAQYREEFPYFNQWVHPFHTRNLDKDIKLWSDAADAVEQAGIDSVLIAKLEDPSDYGNEITLVGVATKYGNFDEFYRVKDAGSDAYLNAFGKTELQQTKAAQKGMQREVRKIQRRQSHP